ncbi:ribosome maturation factor RimM [Alteribacillus sp. JSM 102045]|uniref:ribosome maturation factor RimM n=1 Tax=Alteribacillus sp. JSM 102045 TaxID=1562101 RepID=UPI0035C1C928
MMEWFNVGKIVNTHGVRGEIKVLPITDFEEERFALGKELYLSHERQQDKEKVTVKNVRTHKQFVLLTFEEYSTLDEVERWKGGLIQVPEEDLLELEEGEFYYHEIIGCQVYSEDGELLGEVREIISPGANDVWVVKPNKGKKDIMIPYIEDVVKSVDKDNKKIIVHVIEGLLP